MPSREFNVITETVRAEISGNRAVLFAMSESENGGKKERRLGQCRRNKYGFWISEVPLDHPIRPYSNPEAVGYDRLVFNGYVRSWHWDRQRITA